MVIKNLSRDVAKPAAFGVEQRGAPIASRGGVKYLACLVPLLACGADPSPGSPDASRLDAAQIDARQPDAGRPDAQLPALRFYQHALFTDPDDCPDDPLFNCYPMIELCSDGRAVIQVTDIVNGGTYTKTEGTITTTWESGDVPQQITFEATADGRGLTDDWQGWLWEGSEPEFPYCD